MQTTILEAYTIAREHLQDGMPDVYGHLRYHDATTPLSDSVVAEIAANVERETTNLDCLLYDVELETIRDSIDDHIIFQHTQHISATNNQRNTLLDCLAGVTIADKRVPHVNTNHISLQPVTAALTAILATDVIDPGDYDQALEMYERVRQYAEIWDTFIPSIN